MRVLPAFLTVVLCAIILSAAQGANAQGAAPDAATASDAAAKAILDRFTPLFAKYSKISLGPEEGWVDAVDYAIENKMISKELTDLFLKDRACQEKLQSECNLDFDFLYNAQDVCCPLTISGVAQKDGKYQLRASNGFEGEPPYVFVVIKENGAYVIDDAIYSYEGDSYSLKELLRQPPPEDAG